LKQIQSGRSGKFGLPDGKLIMIVVGELSVVELLIHVCVGDEVVEEVNEDQARNIDYEKEFEN
jgi:hypothetical protein